MKKQKSYLITLVAIFSLFMIVSMAAQPIHAQQLLPQGDRFENLYRLLQISGQTDDNASFLLRPFVRVEGEIRDAVSYQNIYSEYFSKKSESSRFSFNLYEPVWFQSYNTAIPRGGMDGAVWQGKGYNNAFSTGMTINYGLLHFTFRPVIGFSQNREFDLGPYAPPRVSTRYYRGTVSEFGYRDFRGGIDQPVRFGPNSFQWFDMGDSSLEVRYSGFSAGLSNQRLWTGPGVHNSLQFGYNAPGFLHLRLGTYRPVETRVGSFEGMYVFGGIRRSDYFNDNISSLHSVNTLALVYSPAFAKGLSVGVVRTFIHTYPNNFSEYREQASKLFEAALRVGLQDEENPTGHDPDNQIGSLFARWYFPQSGFEVYFEYARNDHNVDFRDFRAHPNNSRAYLLGLQKLFSINVNNQLNIGMEVMQTEEARTKFIRRGGTTVGGWYTHSQQVVGFTNRGQIMGSRFGPGPNVQMLSLDLYRPQNSYGLNLGRVVKHNSRTDQFFNRIQEANEEPVAVWEVRNVELLAGAYASFMAPWNLELDVAIEHSYILNHHNLAGFDKNNTRLEVTLRKRIPGWLR